MKLMILLVFRIIKYYS